MNDPVTEVPFRVAGHLEACHKRHVRDPLYSFGKPHWSMGTVSS